jgi:hypothetical protein
MLAEAAVLLVVIPLQRSGLSWTGSISWSRELPDREGLVVEVAVLWA